MIYDYAYIKLVVGDVVSACKYFTRCFDCKIIDESRHQTQCDVALKLNNITIYLQGSLLLKPFDYLSEIGLYADLERINCRLSKSLSCDLMQVRSQDENKICFQTTGNLKISIIRNTLRDYNLNNSCNNLSAVVGIDHFAICVPYKNIQRWEKILHKLFDMEVCFKQSVRSENSGMDSLVMRSRLNKAVRFVFVEPLARNTNCQIGLFLRNNRGVGVQHVAMQSNDIFKSIKKLKNVGTEMIAIPEEFYRKIRHQTNFVGISVDDLAASNIIYDIDNDGYLLQSFSQPILNSQTVFFEVIQRFQSELFGIKNIHALYDALTVEIKKQELTIQ